MHGLDIVEGNFVQGEEAKEDDFNAVVRYAVVIDKPQRKERDDDDKQSTYDSDKWAYWHGGTPVLVARDDLRVLLWRTIFDAPY
jgi:hypothetical protein